MKAEHEKRRNLLSTTGDAFLMVHMYTSSCCLTRHTRLAAWTCEVHEGELEFSTGWSWKWAKSTWVHPFRNSSIELTIIQHLSWGLEGIEVRPQWQGTQNSATTVESSNGTLCLQQDIQFMKHCILQNSKMLFLKKKWNITVRRCNNRTDFHSTVIVKEGNKPPCELL